MGFNLRNLGGRLVGGQVYAPTRASEVALIQAELKSLIITIGESIIICVDIRRLGQPDPTAQAAYEQMRVADNKFIAYSAPLADRASPHSLQFYRTVQAANNPHRQVFLKVEDLEAWLRPQLRDEEVKALEAYEQLRLPLFG